MKKILIGLNERQYGLLKQEKERTSVSISSIIRTIIEGHFENNEIRR